MEKMVEAEEIGIKRTYRKRKFFGKNRSSVDVLSTGNITRKTNETYLQRILFIRDYPRAKQSGKMFSIIILPLIGLLSMSGLLFSQAFRVYNQEVEARSLLDISRTIAQLILTIQRERGLSAIFLSLGSDINSIENLLKEVRLDVDTTLSNKANIIIELYHFNPTRKLAIGSLINSIHQQRLMVDQGISTANDTITFFTNITELLLPSTVRNIELSNGNEIWLKHNQLTNFLRSADRLGILRAIGGTYYSKTSCFISDFDALLITQLDAEANAYIIVATSHDAILYQNYQGNLSLISDTILQISDMKSEILRNSTNCSLTGISAYQRNQNILLWWDRLTIYIDTILEFWKLEVDQVDDNFVKLQQKTKTLLIIQFVIVSLIVVFSVLLGVYSVFSANVMIARLCKYANSIDTKNEELNQEKKKTEYLLSQMLPKAVADSLKNHQPVDAEYYHSVTVFFSDINGFTQISSSCTPNQIVALLNHAYSTFDSAVEKYDAYKVETRGDSYMVVSGVLTSNKNKHAQQIADMSIELVKCSETMFAPHDSEIPIHIRVGIHSGPVAAGVVGITIPRYCLLGDTVNIASRMKASGEALKIHITQSTKILLINAGDYDIEQDGTIDVKGKGEINTYWLCRSK